MALRHVLREAGSAALDVSGRPHVAARGVVMVIVDQYSAAGASTPPRCAPKASARRADHLVVHVDGNQVVAFA